MSSTSFGEALERYQSWQYARYMDEVDRADAFDMEVEREMDRIGKLPFSDALEELGLEWDTNIKSTLKGRLEDVIDSRTNDDD